MRRICLSGFSELSREWANEQPDDVEIWGSNESHIFLKKLSNGKQAHRWFQLHPRNWNQEKVDQSNGKYAADSYGRGQPHVDWLAQCGIPVYQMAVDERIPTSLLYPLDAVTERFGTPNIDGIKFPYLTSTMAYMLAQALLEGVDEIRLAGIEMVIGTEYVHQKPCLEFYLGMAIGMGVKVVLSPWGSGMLAAPLYAVDFDKPMPVGDMVPVQAIPRQDVFVAVMEKDGEAIGFPN